jgi:hypothetical protein
MVGHSLVVHLFHARPIVHQGIDRVPALVSDYAGRTITNLEEQMSVPALCVRVQSTGPVTQSCGAIPSLPAQRDAVGEDHMHIVVAPDSECHFAFVVPEFRLLDFHGVYTLL